MIVCMCVSSVLEIQCRVLSADFSKMDDAGWGGGRGEEGGAPLPPPTRAVLSPAVIVQFCRLDFSLCVLCGIFEK